jgi:hypothetical protein
MLAVVRPFLDARTQAKIRTVHALSPEAVAAGLAAQDLGLSQETLSWIEAVQRTAPAPRTLPVLPADSTGLRLSDPRPAVEASAAARG